jgi:hypothetical protein
LEKAIHNIKEDWPNLRSKFEISEALKIEDVTIVPLIVTDNFEGDLRLYKDTILKTSLLELEVNFKNNKKDLLEIYFQSQPVMNSLNNELKSNKVNPVNWDLWKERNKCSVENLIENIEHNAVWKELENNWKLEDIRRSLYY